MNPYLTAIQALENCVKDAMENNVDASTQSEIWKHYQGIKAISKQLDQDTIRIDTDSLSTNTVTFSDVDLTGDLNIDLVSATQSGEPINIVGGLGEDIITFN